MSSKDELIEAMLSRLFDATNSLAKNAFLIHALSSFLSEPSQETYRRWQEEASKTLLGGKLSQVLSSHVGLLPEEWNQRLRHDFCEEPPAHVWEITEYKVERFRLSAQNLETREILSNFVRARPRVHATGTLGQVYLWGDFAVKVLHPQIREEVAALKDAISFVSAALGLAGYRALATTLEQIPNELQVQTDMRNEFANMLSYERQVEERSYETLLGLRVPHALDADEDVLLMTALRTVLVSDPSVSQQDRERTLAYLALMQFEDSTRGLLHHADLHVSNFGVCPTDGSFVIYDFGLVGQMEESTACKISTAVCRHDVLSFTEELSGELDLSSRMALSEVVGKDQSTCPFPDKVARIFFRHPLSRNVTVSRLIRLALLSGHYFRLCHDIGVVRDLPESCVRRVCEEGEVTNEELQGFNHSVALAYAWSFLGDRESLFPSVRRLLTELWTRRRPSDQFFEVYREAVVACLPTETSAKHVSGAETLMRLFG
jgi:AcrR family transcriptional regulator